MPLPISHSLVFFEEENYLIARYDLVKEVCTFEVFFLTLLRVQKEGINYNYGTSLSDFQIYLSNFKADGVDHHRSSWQIYLKLQLHQ